MERGVVFHVETYEYDGLNRVKSIVQKKDATTIASYTYSYDLVGNKTKVEELGGRSVSYTYDELYRLTKETIVDPVRGNRTIEYGYDAVGNRLLKKDTAVGDIVYRYNQNDWLLDESMGNTVTTAYSYDNNGNTKTRTTGTEITNYVWDTQNRLMGASIGNNGVTTQQMAYEYNAEGMRTRSTVNGVETRYLLDENRQYAQVLEEYNTSGIQSRYVYGAELDLISQTRGTATSCYLEDGHSGIRQLTNSFGTVTDQYSYDGYGNVIYSAGNTQNAYQYRSEQSDPNLGMQYLRARYYDMRTGRFANVDPFEGYQESPISRHRYIYTNGNPINGIDPTGLTTATEIGATLEVLGVLAGAALAQFHTGKILEKFDGRTPIEWKGIQVGAGFSVGLPASIGTTIVSATGTDSSKTYSGQWAIISGSPSLGPLNPFSAGFSLTGGAFAGKSPRFIGANPTALQGGYLQGRVGTAVVGAGFSLYSQFIMGYGEGLFTFNFQFAPTFGLRLSFITLATGISIAIPGSYDNNTPLLPG